MRKLIINPKNVKQADVVVGIPSYEEEDSIGFVTRQVGLGLRRYYPQFKSVIINCDNYSPDDTRGAFLNADTQFPKIYVSTPPGVTGKGYNFENLYSLVKQLGARAVAVLDADLRSITPEWVKFLLDPVLARGYDYVTPVYARHKYDGTITNNLCYPLMFGLLGRNIRQPIGGDFAFSRALCLYWKQQPWNTAIRQYGIDIFQTAHAVLGGFRVCQAGLGSKVHKPSAPKLGPMFVQVVHSFFSIIVSHQDQLRGIKRVETPPVFGLKQLGKPQELTVKLEKIRGQAWDRWNQNEREVERLLAPANYKLVEPMFQQKKLDISKELWVRMVYDLIAAFNTACRIQQQERLAEALKPLYFGRVASLIQQTFSWSTSRTEKEFLAQAKLFFKLRGYLLKKL